MENMPDKIINHPLIKALRDKASEILPPGSRMALYGSRSRGEARADSDWDVHILVPGEERISFDTISNYAYPLEQIGWDFEEYVTVMVYSYSGWQKRSFLPYYKNVEHDKIIIFQN